MPKKIITFGEIVLRLATPDFKRFIQTNRFESTFGGGEVNVVAALCNYGLNGIFVSKIPDNPIGDSAINYIREFGVGTQFIARGGKRIGIYFLETGASMRASDVVYDRKESSITDVNPNEFDFDAIFEGADWFHTSGITPALSDKTAELTEIFLKEAKARGITTSMDLNYRKKLWSPEKAKVVMNRLCYYVDVCIGIDICIGDENDTPETIGFNSPKTEENTTGLDFDSFKKYYEKMARKYGFKYIASSIRESKSASDNTISALEYDGINFHQTKQHAIRIVDRVGTGDSFASGFIYGLVTGMNGNEAAEFGVAASALKHTILGDFNHATLEEVQQLIIGDSSGRIQN